LKRSLLEAGLDLESSGEAERTADLDPGTDPQQSPIDPVPAWELVEAGRYMPRRFKGSFPGRELG
jgi:hypothetical protein